MLKSEEIQKMLNDKDVQRYIQTIDNDIKRFIQLEKSWIANISHKVMQSGNNFVHEDRAELRKKLIDYLYSRISTKQDRGRIIWKKKNFQKHKTNKTG